MPYRRFEWLEHLKAVEREYRLARFALDRLKSDLRATPGILGAAGRERGELTSADANLEGTYLVRLFAAFEASLRSFDCTRNNDLDRKLVAAVLIDTTGGKRVRNIPKSVRDGAHVVRRLRNYWAHESEQLPCLLRLDQCRARLAKFLSYLPETWG